MSFLPGVDDILQIFICSFNAHLGTPPTGLNLLTPVIAWLTGIKSVIHNNFQFDV
jgi:hypothetical protein